MSTLIEFVAVDAPVGPTAESGDFNLWTILFVTSVLIFGLSFFIYHFYSKKCLQASSVCYGKHVKADANLNNTKIKYLFITVPLSLLLIAFSYVCVLNAHASENNFNNDNEKLMCTPSVKAFVNTETGEVNIEDGIITNVSDDDIYLSAVSVSLMDGIDDGNCQWTVEAFDTKIYNGPATEEFSLVNPSQKMEMYRSETVHFSTNINPEVAKSLVGKTVASVSYDIEKSINFKVEPENELFSIVPGLPLSVDIFSTYQVCEDNSLLIKTSYNEVKEVATISDTSGKYVFIGWYVDDVQIQNVDPKLITDDLVFTAKFYEIPYEISFSVTPDNEQLKIVPGYTFYVDNNWVYEVVGDSSTLIITDNNEEIIYEVPTVLAGDKKFQFEAWYVNDVAIEKNTPYPITSSISFVANFDQLFTVTFADSVYTEEHIVSIDVIEGNLIPQEPIPTAKENGYKFGKWCTDAELTNFWDFETDVVDKNMILYQKWKVLFTFESEDLEFGYVTQSEQNMYVFIGTMYLTYQEHVIVGAGEDIQWAYATANTDYEFTNWQESVSKVNAKEALVPTTFTAYFRYTLSYITFTSQNYSPTHIKLSFNNGSGYTPNPLAFQVSQDAEHWIDLTMTEDNEFIFPTLSSYGSKFYLKAKNSHELISHDENHYWSFSSDLPYKLSGDLCLLLNSDASKVTEIPEYCFYRLFDSKSNHGATSQLLSVGKMPGPDVALNPHCYERMFENCVNLETAPALPALVVPDYAYHRMFNNCKNLVNIPQLPATEIYEHCYDGMFFGCLELVLLSKTGQYELPATELEPYCYAAMFENCRKLNSAPILPAGTYDVESERYQGSLAEGCYSHMFKNCDSLRSGPSLKSIEFDEYCYSHMFENCTSLNSLPYGFLDVGFYPEDAYSKTFQMKRHCFEYMFTGCSGLYLPVVLPQPSLDFEEGSVTLAPYCFTHMFDSCTHLTMFTIHYEMGYWNSSQSNSVTEFFTDTAEGKRVLEPFEGCFSYMLKDCYDLTYIFTEVADCDFPSFEELAPGEAEKYPTLGWFEGISDVSGRTRVFMWRGSETYDVEKLTNENMIPKGWQVISILPDPDPEIIN